MGGNIETLRQVVDLGYCIGCGACRYDEPERVRLVNIEAIGIRPEFAPDSIANHRGTAYCPGAGLNGGLLLSTPPAVTHTEPAEEFGAALEIWEGFASDPEIRRSASSGGLLTALSLFCLESQGMRFVLHTGMDESTPWQNKTVTSHNREELLSRTGSRYAPSSPCEGLGQIEAADGPCVFIGKPCDSAAVMALRTTRPALDAKLGLVLTFFCAGTPSTQGTLRLMEQMGYRRQDVSAVRYRGNGWPGRFTVSTRQPDPTPRTMTYAESWGQLTSYRPLRCNLCPDGLGRLSDLACGDAWESYDGAETTDPGRSLVLVRTERGRELLRRAREAGVVTLEPVNAAAVLEAQKNLLRRRRELHGRLSALRTVWMKTPRFEGFGLRESFRKLPLRLRARVFAGTLRRAIQRGWWNTREAERKSGV